MKTLLLLLLCLPASAALPPSPEPSLPGVTRLEWQSLGWRYEPPIPRPAPLLSPKHASQPRSTPMFRPASATEPPLLPMQGFHRKVQSEYGTDEFTAQATQPANQSVLMEFSTEMAPNTWVGLAFFPAYPAEQPVFAGVTTYRQMIYIRAKATPTMPTGMVPMSTTGPAIWINPAVRGSFARRGAR